MSQHSFSQRSLKSGGCGGAGVAVRTAIPYKQLFGLKACICRCKTLIFRCHQTSDIQTLPDTVHHAPDPSDIRHSDIARHCPPCPRPIRHQTFRHCQILSTMPQTHQTSDIQTLPDTVRYAPARYCPPCPRPIRHQTFRHCQVLSTMPQTHQTSDIQTLPDTCLMSDGSGAW